MEREDFLNEENEYSEEESKETERVDNQQERASEEAEIKEKGEEKGMMERLAEEEGVSVEELKARIERMKQKRLDLGKQDLIRWQEIVLKKSGELENRYPNPREFLTFHLLIGSTPKEEKILHFDFPGEDSIEKFLENFSFDNE